MSIKDVGLLIGGSGQEEDGVHAERMRTDYLILLARKSVQPT